MALSASVSKCSAAGKLSTPLAEGNRIKYNFVKPHMAFDGKTPVQAAGLYVKG